MLKSAHIHTFMIKSAKCLYALAALALLIEGAAARTISWVTPTGRTNVTSTMQLWDKSYQFELGAFKAGFTPTAANTDLWLTNWVAAQRTTYDVVQRKFGSSYTVTNNNAPMTQNAKAYIWGFAGSELSGEWILITKTNSWLWPQPNDAMPPLTFSTGSASAVLGTVNTNTNAPFHLQTAAVANSAPPPTTWDQWAQIQLGQTNHSNPDYNSNGITDIWEYALHNDGSGRDPDPSSWLQQVDVGGSNYLELHIPRRRDHPASYTVEVSTDLQNWSSGPGYTEVVADTIEALVVRDKFAIGEGNDHRFMRVRVSVP